MTTVPTRFYIASALGNVAEVRALAAEFLRAGWSQTFDWTGALVPRDQITDQHLRDVSSQEYLGISNADIVVILLPGGRGTHVELGIALRTTRARVFVVGRTRGDFLEPSGRPCAFYHHPRVTRVTLTGWEETDSADFAREVAWLVQGLVATPVGSVVAGRPGEAEDTEEQADG